MIFKWLSDIFDEVYSSLTHQEVMVVDVDREQVIVRAIALLQPGKGGDISEDAVSKAAALLLGLLPRVGDKTSELFHAGLLQFPCPSVESVALREGPNGTEVYLTRRPKEDPFYPGQWHCHGRMIRNGETIEEALQSLAEGEYGGGFIRCVLAGNTAPPGQERGHNVLLIYVVTLAGEPTGGRWFAIDDLPKPMVAVHKEVIIPIALASIGRTRTL